MFLRLHNKTEQDTVENILWWQEGREGREGLKVL
jgi:hypothetical protein